jgi:hypothetical protein
MQKKQKNRHSLCFYNQIFIELAISIFRISFLVVKLINKVVFCGKMW